MSIESYTATVFTQTTPQSQNQLNTLSHAVGKYLLNRYPTVLESSGTKRIFSLQSWFSMVFVSFFYIILVVSMEGVAFMIVDVHPNPFLRCLTTSLFYLLHIAASTGFVLLNERSFNNRETLRPILFSFLIGCFNMAVLLNPLVIEYLTEYWIFIFAILGVSGVLSAIWTNNLMKTFYFCHENQCHLKVHSVYHLPIQNIDAWIRKVESENPVVDLMVQPKPTISFRGYSAQLIRLTSKCSTQHKFQIVLIENSIAGNIFGAFHLWNMPQRLIYTKTVLDSERSSMVTLNTSNEISDIPIKNEPPLALLSLLDAPPSNEFNIEYTPTAYKASNISKNNALVFLIPFVAIVVMIQFMVALSMFLIAPDSVFLLGSTTVVLYAFISSTLSHVAKTLHIRNPILISRFAPVIGLLNPALYLLDHSWMLLFNITILPMIWAYIHTRNTVAHQYYCEETNRYLDTHKRIPISVSSIPTVIEMIKTKDFSGIPQYIPSQQKYCCELEIIGSHSSNTIFFNIKSHTTTVHIWNTVIEFVLNQNRIVYSKSMKSPTHRTQ
jgi:hypothetical protein